MNEKLATLKDIVKETSGCTFYLYCDGDSWSMRINKTKEYFKGDLDYILTDAIAKILQHRYRRKDASQRYKKYVYNPLTFE